MMLVAAAIFFVAYLLGSFSAGYFLTRWLKKKDIRTIGPRKNIGTTNVYYVLGLKYAVITAVFDLLKAIAPMLIAIAAGFSQPQVYAAGALAVIGHIFPFYLGFKGGRGVASLIAVNFFIFYYLNLFSLVFLIVSLVYAFSVSIYARRKIVKETKSLAGLRSLKK